MQKIIIAFEQSLILARYIEYVAEIDFPNKYKDEHLFHVFEMLRNHPELNRLDSKLIYDFLQCAVKSRYSTCKKCSERYAIVYKAYFKNLCSTCYIELLNKNGLNIMRGIVKW